MEFYKIKKVGHLEKSRVSEIFHWLGGAPIDIFKPKKWKCLYIESRPFIDQDSYECFVKLFLILNEREINFIHYPLVDHQEYLQFFILPDYSVFDNVMDEFTFRVDGGIAFGAFNNWAMHSNPDNHILFVGYDKQLHSKVEASFRYNKFILTKEKVINIYKNHKSFLSGDLPPTNKKS